MKPKIYTNSKVPVILSYLSPVTWVNVLMGRPMFRIWGITFGPFIWIRGEANEMTIRHETIHTHQYMETWIVGFLILYGFDWLKGMIKYRDGDKAYRMIRAEQEAYEFERDENYLENRVPREWIKKYKV